MQLLSCQAWSDGPKATSLAEAIDIDFSSEVDIFISINMIYSGTGGSWFFILNNNQMPDRNDGELFQNEKMKD